PRSSSPYSHTAQLEPSSAHSREALRPFASPGKQQTLKMKFKNEFDGQRRRKEHPHSSHTHTPYLGLDPRNGVPIQCQFCSGKAFRRSTLRGDDFTQSDRQATTIHSATP